MRLPSLQIRLRRLLAPAETEIRGAAQIAAEARRRDSPFRPGEDWPELHESYDEMVEAKVA